MYRNRSRDSHRRVRRRCASIGSERIDHGHDGHHGASPQAHDRPRRHPPASILVVRPEEKAVFPILNPPDRKCPPAPDTSPVPTSHDVASHSLVRLRQDTIASRVRGARRPKPISKYDLGGMDGDARARGRFGFFRRSANDERGRGGMFGRRSGAARDAADLTRREHAGAETREELERLHDDVLRAIVDEEYEEALRIDAEANKKSAAEAALDLEDNARDDERGRKTLAELDLDEETLARIELVKTILKERKDRVEQAARRRCISMARSVLGDEAVADFDDFARFVHRGLDTEGVDDRELRRLYANCLQSRPGSRTAVSDVLSAEKLAESVEKGQWAKHWVRYVGDARQKALDKGPCGASAAVFGVTCADPVTSPPFPPLLKSLSLPYGYLKYFLTFAALPLLWPIAGVKRLGIGGGVAEALHVWRYVLPQTLRKVRGGGMDIAALFLCVTPLWTLAVLTTVSLFIYYFRMVNVNDVVFFV